MFYAACTYDATGSDNEAWTSPPIAVSGCGRCVSALAVGPHALRSAHRSHKRKATAALLAQSAPVEAVEALCATNLVAGEWSISRMTLAVSYGIMQRSQSPRTAARSALLPRCGLLLGRPRVGRPPSCGNRAGCDWLCRETLEQALAAALARHGLRRIESRTCRRCGSAAEARLIRSRRGSEDCAASGLDRLQDRDELRSFRMT